MPKSGSNTQRLEEQIGLTTSVLHSAEMVKAPKKMCGHYGTLATGPGVFDVRCSGCGGRWVLAQPEGFDSE